MKFMSKFRVQEMSEVVWEELKLVSLYAIMIHATSHSVANLPEEPDLSAAGGDGFVTISTGSG